MKGDLLASCTILSPEMTAIVCDNQMRAKHKAGRDVARRLQERLVVGVDCC